MISFKRITTAIWTIWQFWKRHGCGGGRSTTGDGGNNDCMYGRFGGIGASEQVGEPDVICHFARRKIT